MSKRRFTSLAPWGSRRRGALLALARVREIATTEGGRGLWARFVSWPRWAPRFWRRAPCVPPDAPIEVQYEAWRRRRPPRPGPSSSSATPAVVDVWIDGSPPGDVTVTLASLERQTHGAWRALPRTDEMSLESDVEPFGAGPAATGPVAFVTVVRAGDRLAPDALGRLIAAAQDDPRLDVVYSDEDSPAGTADALVPFFKPEWSPSLLLSMDYMNGLCLVRTDVARGASWSSAYDLALQASEKTNRIGRVAAPLYTSIGARDSTREKRDLEKAAARRGFDATIELGAAPGTYRLRPRLPELPTVTVVIPTRDQPARLRRCIESLESVTSYPHLTILVVDHESKRPDTLDYLRGLGHETMRFEEPFNFARIVNRAVERIDSELFLLLNDDVRALAPEWMHAMVEIGALDYVGAVGARLVYPDGTIQHDGIVVGATTRHVRATPATPGYPRPGEVVRDVAAVTGACLLTRVSAWRRVGGWDERYPVAFGDVDYCLRLHAAGYSVVQTPHATLEHEEGATRGRVHPLADERLFVREWIEGRGYVDPFYNPNLSSDHPYALESGKVLE